MDYNWLVEAAGQDHQRMAQLSLLLASTAVVAVQNMTAETKPDVLKDILAMRAAMHEIGLRMGAQKEMEQIVNDVWGNTGRG